MTTKANGNTYEFFCFSFSYFVLLKENKEKILYEREKRKEKKRKIEKEKNKKKKKKTFTIECLCQIFTAIKVIIKRNKSLEVSFGKLKFKKPEEASNKNALNPKTNIIVFK